jgi:hypothetical protein
VKAGGWELALLDRPLTLIVHEFGVVEGR